MRPPAAARGGDDDREGHGIPRRGETGEAEARQKQQDEADKAEGDERSRPDVSAESWENLRVAEGEAEVREALVEGGEEGEVGRDDVAVGRCREKADIEDADAALASGADVAVEGGLGVEVVHLGLADAVDAEDAALEERGEAVGAHLRAKLDPAEAEAEGVEGVARRGEGLGGCRGPRCR